MPAEKPVKQCHFKLEWKDDDYFTMTRRYKEDDIWGENVVIFYAHENATLPSCWTEVTKMLMHCFKDELTKIQNEMTS